jgi:3'(2'), 5'-bisphosphate nucleotidase
MQYSNQLQLALKASLCAGRHIMEIYESENFEINFKTDDSPLTKADIASNKVLINTLSKSNLPIISEESKNESYQIRKSWKSLWIIDPIDGTKEFIKRNGEFTVNVALIKDNNPVLGIVYAPFTKELYFAEHGFGAFKVENISYFDQLQNLQIIDLRNSNQLLPKTFTLVLSRSHMNRETKHYVNKMKIEHGLVASKFYGSSLKICKVAEGYAHCYPRFGPTMEWDTAAAHAVATYAGCKMIDVENSESLLYNKESLLNPFFLVTRDTK